MEFKNICVNFGQKKVLNNLSFSLQSNKITAVIGKNGCGKSTLVSCVTNRVRHTGQIIYEGNNVPLMPPRKRAQLIAVLPQILPDVSLTVDELVCLGRTPYIDLGQKFTDIDRKYVDDAINSVGLSSMKNKPVNCLSGGERQKAYLAMVLAQNTHIIILDEPMTYMDMGNEAGFLDLIKDLKTMHGKTIMVVMHNLTKAVEIADNILIIDNGQGVFFCDSAECVESGIIERVFNVKKTTYIKDGTISPLFYR